MKLYLFIIHANNKKAQKTWKAVKKILSAEDVPYRSYYTESEGHALEIAKKISYINRDQIEAIITVGGDGTIHEVINGLKDMPEVPVGFLPGGSGNDIIRGLGFNKKKSLAYILKRSLLNKQNPNKVIDAGVLSFPGNKRRNELFVSTAGIGFDGEVTKLTNRSWYKKWFQRFGAGNFAYTVSMFRLLFSYTPVDAAVTVDGCEHQFSSVWLIAAGNMPYYGGGMKICPSARPDDGLLELCIVHGLHPLKLLFLFVTVFSGNHKELDGVTILEGRRISIASKEPLTVQADGELLGTTPVECSVIPSALSIKV
ncbi:diacylglycerol/lipid kinase family protein [Fictibacillus sp. FJAT-27399]|uniref:diacylglycerol/lipid kinase family protein n=1 Tax=Fictibacillus sp. FJAT-27399 TaxID=1729689 RepID=UPI000781B931|nr:diacylglycerol kinase family protein [Fictibacillus sp. FJAT-27399]